MDLSWMCTRVPKRSTTPPASRPYGTHERPNGVTRFHISSHEGLYHSLAEPVHTPKTHQHTQKQTLLEMQALLNHAMTKYVTNPTSCPPILDASMAPIIQYPFRHSSRSSSQLRALSRQKKLELEEDADSTTRTGSSNIL